MATAYLQPGEVVTLTAPYAVAAGAGAVVGQLFGVARTDIANGVAGEFQLTGVHKLAKATGAAWTDGANIYWDNTNKNCTTTATSNYYIGVACNGGAASGDAVGYVRLNGIGIKATG